MTVHRPGERTSSYWRRQEDDVRLATIPARHREWAPSEPPAPAGPLHTCQTEADALEDRLETLRATYYLHTGGVAWVDGERRVRSRHPDTISGAELGAVLDHIDAAERRLRAIMGGT